jgi:predicted Rossmann fold flavoprotein
MQKQKQLVVIGGGAAGFFCAVNAANLNPQLKVTLLEKSNKLLSKVKVSGGGRCNVTHACFDINEMSSKYPRGKNFVKKTFHQFFTTDTIKWFEDRGVKLKTEKDGRMFPITDSSQTIINCLLNECNLYNVEVKLNADVKCILTSDEKLVIELNGNKFLEADFICVASGGYPKTEMFNWLKSTGHTLQQPVPSLFTFNLPRHPISSLTGVSVEKVKIKIEGTRLIETGPLLVTHWGLSGPVVLRLSAWGARELNKRHYKFSIHINWVPEHLEYELKKKFQEFRISSPNKKILNLPLTNLPARLWEFLLKESQVDLQSTLRDFSIKSENKLIKNLTDYILIVEGKTTFKEEFVTAGGISLSEIDANTMRSKKISRLYFAGEVLDVDGITGGYNFQHAWTSAYIAAKSIASSASTI